MLRHGVNSLAKDWLGLSFPWSTLSTVFVNVVGGLVMGLFAGWFAYRGEQTSQSVRLFLTTGVLGGFTTFSAFTLDAVLMWEGRRYAVAGGYVLGSVALAIIGLTAGMAMARTWLA